MKRPVLAVLILSLLVACAAGVTVGLLAVKRALSPSASSYPPLTASQTASVGAAIALLRQHGLTDDAALATMLLRQGKWHAAAPNDTFLMQAERAGDTPFAYTLADGRRVIAVALAPRFFTDTTPTARAALMVHELGHVRAYRRSGRSDEYDGYRHEYDTHARLGLTERDGLTYFAMLDGVNEYVLPRVPSYKTHPDIKDYLAQSGG